MGMSAEQFFQVVLLPQGQFARFLHASAQDKEALLQKLFSTDRFRAVERWLADRRLAAEKEGRPPTGVSVLVAQVAQAADVSVPDLACAGPARTPPVVGVEPDLAATAGRAGTGRRPGRRRERGPRARARRQERGRAARRPAAPPPCALRRQPELQDAAPAIAGCGPGPTPPCAPPQVEGGPRGGRPGRDARRPGPPAEAAGARADRGRVGTAVAAMPGTRPPRRCTRPPRSSGPHLGRLDALRAVARQAADEDKNAKVARARAVAIDSELAAAAAERASREQAAPAGGPGARRGQSGRRRAACCAGRGRTAAGWRPTPPPWCWSGPP